VGAAALSYDANGNLAGDGVWSYGYDPQDRLVSATAANPTRNVTYGYDALGRRRSRTSGAATARFLWAGDQEIAE
jgi:YD repeat-containing protein